MRTTVAYRSGAVSAALLFLACCAGAAQAQLDKDQQKCVYALNKDAAKVAATQGKLNTACLRNAGKGKLPVGQSADECLFADDKQKVAKATAKTDKDFAKKCTTLPTFGIPAGTAPATIANTVAIDNSLSLLDEVFGASLTTAVIDCAADKNGCKCQQAVSKDYEKLAASQFKEFAKCKKLGLLSGTSASVLEKCVVDAGTPGSIAADTKEKLSKRRLKLAADIDKKCDTPGVNTARAFPGFCAGRSGTGLADCIAARVTCRVCLTINSADGLSVDCDSFDDGQLNVSCPRETFTLRSPAEPANTPGSPGVTVTNANLTTQFGSTFSLNNARYTRFRLNDTIGRPDAILVLVPGFEGGANDFKILAENLLPRLYDDYGLVFEVWAYDRRSNQLEDTEGLDIAEANNDPLIGLDWLFGSELSLPLSPELAAGPNRRAVFHGPNADVAFMASWTGLVFSRDIDAIVEKARAVSKDHSVYLGGHSAGTGFAARYAATDFNLTGVGPAQPGYAKLRGLVLLEGGGGSTQGPALTNDTLDRIIAKFDGGLYGAVRDNSGRCVDGVTACTVANEATTCSGQTPPKCTPAAFAYSIVPGLLNPRILAAVEPAAIQGVSDPDTGQIILEADQGSAGNNAVAKVPDLATLALLPQGTVYGGIGSFVDDDGLIAGIASFVATSVGAPGPIVGGLTTWQDITEGPMPPSAVPDNGPAPTSLPAPAWGQEKEVTRFDRLLTTFFAGGSNFTDWYYPSSGLSVTSVSGVCAAGTCTAGNVGASCSANGDCSQSISLDSTALSIGRGRRDIENLTQAASIDIPVIGFGGSNGLARVPASYLDFAESIGACTASSCDGTPRVVDPSNPNPAFPTFGGVDGGFEVHISVGFAHVDVLTAEDTPDNNVLAPLAAFLARNVP